MLIKLSVIALVLFCCAAGGVAQSNSESEGEMMFINMKMNESTYSYGTVVRCYEATNSLTTFIQCLEGSVRTFDSDTDRWIPPTDLPILDYQYRKGREPNDSPENFGIPYFEDRLQPVRNFNFPTVNE